VETHGVMNHLINHLAVLWLFSQSLMFSCPLHDCAGVCMDHVKALVMWTPRNLNLSTPSPVVHDKLLGFADVEGEVVVLAPHCQVSDLLPIGCLIAVGDQALQPLCRQQT
jgi:hypothetical protein